MILDAELDPCVSWGFAGGPERATRIVSLSNGRERRNARWSNSRRRWTLPFQNITPGDYADILAMFEACDGQNDGFLFRDPLDHVATLESLGNAPAGSAAVQLIKTYTKGGRTRTRDITRPLATGFTLYQAGVAKAGTLDTTTGLFTPTTAWTEGEALTWSGEFRVPVRFANDWLPFSIDDRAGGEFAINGSVEIIELVGE